MELGKSCWNVITLSRKICLRWNLGDAYSDINFTEFLCGKKTENILKTSVQCPLEILRIVLTITWFAWISTNFRLQAPFCELNQSTQIYHQEKEVLICHIWHRKNRKHNSYAEQEPVTLVQISIKPKTKNCWKQKWKVLQHEKQENQSTRLIFLFYSAISIFRSMGVTTCYKR